LLLSYIKNTTLKEIGTSLKKITQLFFFFQQNPDASQEPDKGHVNPLHFERLFMVNLNSCLSLIHMIALHVTPLSRIWRTIV
jgi:hypothetical protein